MPKPAGFDGYPYISTKDFTAGGIDFDGAKRITKTDFDAISRKIRPELGDLLISRYGTIGAIREVLTDAEFLCSYSIAIVKTLQTSLNQMLVMALRSPLLKTQMAAETRATAQPDLGLESIRRLALPLAPQAEQERITMLIEHFIRVADALARQANSSATKVSGFEKSILAKAFRGELVPQDPNDEPASILLERIRAEKTEQAKTQKQRS
jgi:type I restriction enzyme S subunit